MIGPRHVKRCMAITSISYLVCATGCSSFDRDWNAMLRDDQVTNETASITETTDAESAIAGCWQGTWLSEANGHTGGLRCIITEGDERDMIQARYHATYGNFFTFEYTVPLAVHREGEIHHFAGEADLGWLAGGQYVYEGMVAGDSFTSTYESKRDQGTFEMTRVTTRIEDRHVP